MTLQGVAVAVLIAMLTRPTLSARGFAPKDTFIALAACAS